MDSRADSHNVLLCLPRRFSVFVSYGIAIFFKNFIHERYFESFHDVFERSVYTCVVPKNGDECQRVIGSVINHRVVLDAFFDKSVVDSRLRFGFSSIGIDVGHTHGHAQTNGIGELFPCFYIAADFVVLSQNLINGILMFFGGRGKLFQYFPRIFEIDEQGVVNLIHRFVGYGRFLHIVFIIGPRERSVHIGKFQCRETIHDVAHGSDFSQIEVGSRAHYR